MKISNILQLFVLTLSVVSVSCQQQISTACTTSMVSSFTPCLNFLSGSSSGAGGTSPTTECCRSLKEVMRVSMDCVCLIVTANIPININRALNLPRACHISGVPIQCKAGGSPLPAPGPYSLLFSPPPSAASPLSPQASKAAAAGPDPERDNTEIPEPGADEEPAAPTTEPAARPSLPSFGYAVSPQLPFVAFLVILVLKLYII